MSLAIAAHTKVRRPTRVPDHTPLEGAALGYLGRALGLFLLLVTLSGCLERLPTVVPAGPSAVATIPDRFFAATPGALTPPVPPGRYTLGAVTLLATSQPLAAVDAVLTAHGWRGMTGCGPDAGRRLGPATSDGFGDRVRRALDPDRRFR